MRGFSLIEMLIVIGLSAVLLASGTYASLRSVTRASARQDLETLRETLLAARADASNDMCETKECASGAAHGVHITSEVLVAFEGDSYQDRNPSFDQITTRSGEEPLAGPEDIVFRDHGDRADPSGVFIESEPDGYSYELEVNEEGEVGSIVRLP